MVVVVVDNMVDRGTSSSTSRKTRVCGSSPTFVASQTTSQGREEQDEQEKDGDHEEHGEKLDETKAATNLSTL